MENEYQFNYDQIKQIFESVPPSNSISKKPQTIAYKTHFQPRSIKDTRSNRYPSIIMKPDKKSSTLLVKVQCFQVYQLMPMERHALQTQQGFYPISNTTK